MEVTESGIVMAVALRQPLKAPRPMEVAESGIVMVVGRDPSFTPQRGIYYEAHNSPPQAPKFLRTHLNMAPQARKFWA